ncbi:MULTISPECIES: DUF5676 family membrane protein [unclassified Hyphomonas]|uniref:DUF5676 family membrane protein n=1 Tax=unclassified Hyphomonas TaxID=2630699 RepID=UPI000458B6CC|nr:MULTISPECIES: DUF5676 family membrane protein [unclassified Hyphomonas]KCZ50100.1 hypothetical protein HY17_03025 [Hyphomonas sp. CY54-11-8]
MKLNPNRLFVAVAIAIAVAWLICTALVGIAPSGMMSLSGHMMHTNLHGMAWSMNPTGIIAGLFVWSLSGGALAWLIATLYNYFGRSDG